MILASNLDGRAPGRLVRFTRIPASIGGRRGERHEECLELLLAAGGKLGEPPCG